MKIRTISRWFLKEFFKLKLQGYRQNPRNHWIQKTAWTPESIAKAANTWNVYPGWEGDTCFRCGLKANVLSGGTGWFCDNCGEYTPQYIHGSGRLPHEHPDEGPDAETIRKGHMHKYREECR
jgi:hypothetical protein